MECVHGTKSKWMAYYVAGVYIIHFIVFICRYPAAARTCTHTLDSNKANHMFCVKQTKRISRHIYFSACNASVFILWISPYRRAHFRRLAHRACGVSTGFRKGGHEDESKKKTNRPQSWNPQCNHERLNFGFALTTVHTASTHKMKHINTHVERISNAKRYKYRVCVRVCIFYIACNIELNSCVVLLAVLECRLIVFTFSFPFTFSTHCLLCLGPFFRASRLFCFFAFFSRSLVFYLWCSCICVCARARCLQFCCLVQTDRMPQRAVASPPLSRSLFLSLSLSLALSQSLVALIS